VASTAAAATSVANMMSSRRHSRSGAASHGKARCRRAQRAKRQLRWFGSGVLRRFSTCWGLFRPATDGFSVSSSWL